MIMDPRLRRSLSIAALYLLTALLLNALRQHDVVGPETAARLMGLLMGAVVLVSANAILCAATGRQRGAARLM